MLQFQAQAENTPFNTAFNRVLVSGFIDDAMHHSVTVLILSVNAHYKLFLMMIMMIFLLFQCHPRHALVFVRFP